MKLPGPDHPISITAAPKRIQVLFDGHLIADSGGALMLQEAGYKAVAYIPRDDIQMAFLSRTDLHTHCPYKGDASYYTIVRDGQVVENAVWTYENPYPAVGAIKDYLAFYPNKVEVIETDEPAGDPAAIARIIEHTDSGSGASQREHWATNVDGPVSADVPAVERPYRDTGAI